MDTVDWYIEEATFAIETQSLPETVEVKRAINKPVLAGDESQANKLATVTIISCC